MNRIVRHSSRIELSQAAIKANFGFIRKKVGEGPVISSVVKANAYGHGIETFVPMAEKAGVRHFSTASAHEAEEVLHSRTKKSDIMIMGILYGEDLSWAIENGIEFYVFDFERLEAALKVAKELNTPAKVHLEAETGTNRTGMLEAEFNKCLTLVKKNKDHLHCYGICSHLGGAESLSNQFKIDQQKQRFKEFLKLGKAKGITPKYRHLACSAAALAMPDTVYDMVRVGVAQYGFWPSPDIYFMHLQDVDKGKDNPMRRVISWKTDVMAIKHVKKGEFIGYGTSYQALRDMEVAVIPLGYCNGYARGLSNRGHVLIKGKKAPIVGLVNMNLFMVDITHIKGVEPGEEVVLIGRQGNNSITVSSFSDTSNLLNNEMISRLPAAIPRYPVR
ncbi:alanine racemase [Roseivirga sp. BDSF3-8]|uniref:alanine racemase n=1 Tax=Roseivirga sp. BDSF3-8 TaxID=3241598 RepID=UPI00353211DC